MIPELLTAITADQAGAYVFDSAYAMQRKWDGKRLVVSTLDGFQAFSKSTGLCSAPVWLAKAIPAGVILDGEIEGQTFHVWDLLHFEGYHLRELPYSQRLASLKMAIRRKALVVSACIVPVETWFDPADKERELLAAVGKRWEGVVFKRLAAPYREGRAGQHFKLKFTKTCTVRVRSVSPTSARVEMLHAGKLANSPDSPILRNPAWLEVCGVSLVGRPAVKVGDYLEVKYLYATSDQKLVQPVMLRLRGDVNDSDCSTGQLIYKREEEGDAGRSEEN